MSYWRTHIWQWVPLGTLLASLLIVLIFYLIDKHILGKGRSKRYFEPCNAPELNAKSNTYIAKDPDEVKPPLPPRTQFLTSDSYESIPELPEYVKMDKEEAQVSPPPMESTESCHSLDVSTEDYDDIGEEKDNQDGEDYDDVG